MIFKAAGLDVLPKVRGENKPVPPAGNTAVHRKPEGIKLVPEVSADPGSAPLSPKRRNRCMDNFNSGVVAIMRSVLHGKLPVLGLAIVALCLLVAAAAASVVSIGNGQVTSIGGTASLNIAIDSVPAGLSGYNINVSVADPTIATIAGVSFPSWATLNLNSSIPASSVNIDAVDLSDQIQTGATDVPLGTVIIRGLKGGSTPIQITVNEFDDDLGNPVSPTVEPGTFSVVVVQPAGNISVTSTPSGAALSLDGVDTGKTTPAVLENVTPADHTVAVSLAGYTPDSKTVTVTAGSTAQADFQLVQIPRTGSISVTSTPPGAEVSIDGVDTGNITPSTFDAIDQGSHVIEISLAGYQTANKTVTVSAVGTELVDFTLIAIPTTGSLAVTSTPGNAAISLDGTDTGKVTPFTFTVITPGDHTVAVSLAGYNNASTTITIVPGEAASADFQLVQVPQTGSISVTSSPAGAEISLDGSDTGEVTPFTFTDVAAGGHTIDVSLAGYNTASKSVTFSAGSTVSVDFQLVVIPPKTGSISVSSSPAGAGISLDGTNTGKITPTTLGTIPPGDHIVTVSLPGYNSASMTVTVSAGSTVQADFVLNQIPQNGSITVTSTPAGATIELDGASTGKVTPSALGGVSPGDHAISVSLPGYSPASQTVTVSAGSTANVNFLLVPAQQTGSISVTSVPAGAAISIDGSGTGKVTPAIIDGLTPGNHMVSATLAGYNPASKTVSVTAGSTVNASFRLVHGVKQADLSITKTVSNATAYVGQHVTWIVTLTNLGPDTAQNIIVSDDSSRATGANRKFVISPNIGFVAGNTWRIPSLKSGQTAKLIEMDVYAFPGTKTDEAKIVRSATKDPDNSNNHASASVIILAKPVPAPKVTGISPSSGEAGSILRTVTVRGDQFRKGATVTLAQSGTNTLVPSRVSVDSGNKIGFQLAIPATASAGTYDVIVTNSDGQSGTLRNVFTVTVPKNPAVNQISPSQGEAGTTIRNILVSGNNFMQGAVVTLKTTGQKDIVLSQVVVRDTHSISGTITVPAGSKPGSRDLVVTNPDGKSGIKSAAFTVIDSQQHRY